MGKIFRILIPIEIVIVILCLLFIYMNRSNSFKTIEMGMEDWRSDYISCTDAGWHVDGDQISVSGDPIILLKSSTMNLAKGHYTLNICYECASNQMVNLFAANENSAFIKGSAFNLDKNLTNESYSFSITENLDNFQIEVKYNGTGPFTISNITLSTNNKGQRIHFLILLLLFGIIDLAILYYYSPTHLQRIELAILAMVLVSSLPLFYPGDGGGHDKMFHLMRIEGIAQELRHRHFPVRIASLWMGGYGYPTSIYYGDILLYFPALLRLCGVSVYRAYKIYVFAINLATASVATVCFNRMFKSSFLGLALAFTYVTASYRLVDLYVRAAVGEYTALLFLPLVVYSIWRIYTKDEENRKESLVSAGYLSIGMAGIITSHVLTAEMTTFFLTVFSLICFRKTFSFRVIRTLFTAMIGTLLLSLFFIVPFIDYYINVPVTISRIVGEGVKKIQKDGLGLADYFAFFKNPFGSSTYMLCTSGIVLTTVLFLGVYLWKRKKASGEIKVLIILSLLSMILASDLFPWNGLAYHFSFFNILAQVQFPWRYIGLTIICETVLFGYVLQLYDGKTIYGYNIKRMIYGSCVVSLFMTFLFTSFYADNASREKLFDTYNLNTYGYMSAEYLRVGKGANGTTTMTTDPKIFTGRISGSNTVDLKCTYRNGTDYDFICKTADEEANVEVPMLHYKGYVAADDQGSSFDLQDSANNTILVHIPAEYEGTVHVRFVSPWYWTAALVISLAAGLIILGYYLLRFIRWWRKNGIVDRSLL